MIPDTPAEARPREHLDAILARLATLADRVDATALAADDGGEVAHADGYRYLLRFLSAGVRVCTELNDAGAPDLGRSVEPHLTWGLDNPDCRYGYTRVRGDAAYRITGRRGSVRHLELQVNTGHQADGDVGGWRAVSALSSDELACAADGSFEVVLSSDRPDGTANWMALDADASYLVVRQYSSDWQREQTAELAIERIDAPSLPPPAPDDATLATDLELLEQWLTTGFDCWEALSRGLGSAPPGDVQPFLPPPEASGMKGQAYGMGSWACAPGDAVIVELDPPTCRMWGVSLCDRWWQSIDFGRRQSSLNDSQAVLTDDGRFVGVISHADPGVANWLDPGGHTAGTLALRYLFPDPPDVLPPLRQRTVAATDLVDQLPPGTPACDAETRQAALAARHAAVAHRFGAP